MQLTEMSADQTRVAVVSDSRCVLDEARRYWEQRGYTLTGTSLVERNGLTCGCIKLEKTELRLRNGTGKK